MFLIVFSHTNMFSLGRPCEAVFQAEPLWISLRFGMQSLSCIGVNLFILISGYFAIHPKFRSLSSFLFQILFFSLFCLFGLFVIGLGLGENLVKTEMLKDAFFIITKYNWFISAYLMLMLFSPLLNAFCDVSSKRQLGFMVILLFLSSTYLGWCTHLSKEFNDGFSFVSFILLYLIGRYFHLHPNYFVMRPARIDAIHFFLYVIVNTIIALWRISNPYHMSLFALNNPFQIYGTMCFFLFFTKLNFENKTINNIAKGTFGIFLLQMHPQVMPYFRKMIKYLFENSSHLVFSASALLTVLVFCLGGLAVDFLRRHVWAKLEEALVNLYDYIKNKLLNVLGSE